jgi:CO/xanthine dehydrogenase FAD-binding subunit
VAQSAVAVGAVDKTAYRVRALEDSLTGKALTSEAMEQACGMLDNIVAEKLGARKTAPYKRRIAAAVLKRAFERMQGGDE